MIIFTTISLRAMEIDQKKAQQPAFKDAYTLTVMLFPTSKASQTTLFDITKSRNPYNHVNVVRTVIQRLELFQRQTVGALELATQRQRIRDEQLPQKALPELMLQLLRHAPQIAQKMADEKNINRASTWQVTYDTSDVNRFFAVLIDIEAHDCQVIISPDKQQTETTLFNAFKVPLYLPGGKSNTRPLKEITIDLVRTTGRGGETILSYISGERMHPYQSYLRQQLPDNVMNLLLHSADNAQHAAKIRNLQIPSTWIIRNSADVTNLIPYPIPPILPDEPTESEDLDGEAIHEKIQPFYTCYVHLNARQPSSSKAPSLREAALIDAVRGDTAAQTQTDIYLTCRSKQPDIFWKLVYSTLNDQKNLNRAQKIDCTHNELMHTYPTQVDVLETAIKTAQNTAMKNSIFEQSNWQVCCTSNPNDMLIRRMTLPPNDGSKGGNHAFINQQHREARKRAQANEKVRRARPTQRTLIQLIAFVKSTEILQAQ